MVLKRLNTKVRVHSSAVAIGPPSVSTQFRQSLLCP